MMSQRSHGSVADEPFGIPQRFDEWLRLLSAQTRERFSRTAAYEAIAVTEKTREQLCRL